MTGYRNRCFLKMTAFCASLMASAAFTTPNAVPSFVAYHCDHRASAATSAASVLLHLSKDKGDCDDDDDSPPSSDEYARALAHNKARTSVRHLLTQRTVQSFLFLLERCRDGHTISWVEDFGDVPGLLTYHGTGAFNLTRFPQWDSFFLDLIEQPKESITVRVKSRSGVLGGGRRGKWNPYLDAISPPAAKGKEGDEKKTTAAKKGAAPSFNGGRRAFGGSYLDALSGSGSLAKKSVSSRKKKGPPKVGAGASYLDVLSAGDDANSKNDSSDSSKKKSKAGKAKGAQAGSSYLDALANDKPAKTPAKMYKPNKDDYAGERFVEFTVDIDPVSLVNRMVSVREQIAEEWVKDLGTLVEANNLILDSYYNNVRAGRDLEEEERGKSSKSEEKDTFEGKDVAAAKEDNDEEADIDADGNSEDLAPFGKEVQSVAYERLSMCMLLDANAFEDKFSSPLRKGNFDLLCLLVTQEAVHRVLREYQTMGEEKEVPLAFLKQFYIDRIDNVFDGNGENGRHDDFVQDLLKASPAIVTTEEGKVGLNDPLRVAKKIIKMREKVATEWRDLMRDIPQQQMELRKAMLEKRIEKSIFGEMNTVEKEPQPTEVIEGGDFE